MANKGPLEKKSGGVLGAIERIGNALPSPFILFLWLVALTTVLAALGVSAVNPTTQEVVTVQSLLTRDGLVWILGSLVSNFSGFAALGIVLVMQMAIGVTEEAAQMIDPSYTTTPANNWYFMIASCFVLTREYLGVCPPDDTQGVLQDMHWAGDYIGYFQSYALGNIYDGQILAALERDMPAWQEEIRKGNFAPSTAGWASTSGSGAAASRRGSWCSGLPAAPWMQNLSCGILTANTPPSTALRPNRRTPGKNDASSIQGRLSAAKPGKLRILSGKPKNRVYFSRLV